MILSCQIFFVSLSEQRSYTFFQDKLALLRLRLDFFFIRYKQDIYDFFNYFNTIHNIHNSSFIINYFIIAILYLCYIQLLGYNTPSFMKPTYRKKKSEQDYQDDRYQDPQQKSYISAFEKLSISQIKSQRDQTKKIYVAKNYYEENEKQQTEKKKKYVQKNNPKIQHQPKKSTQQTVKNFRDRLNKIQSRSQVSMDDTSQDLLELLKGNKNLDESINSQRRERQKRPNRYQQQRQENNGMMRKKPNNRIYEQEQRSQTTQNNYRSQGPKKEYKNSCLKYLKDLKQIQKEGLEGQLKSLKKLFYSTQLVQGYEFKPKNITLKKSSEYPVIVIQYQYNGEKRYMSLRQLIKDQRQKLKDLSEILDTIYKRNFTYVDLAFQQLDVFAFLKAKQSDIRLSRKYRGTKQKQPKLQSMFYYTINKAQNIQFVFFDTYLKDVQFSQIYITEMKNKRPRQAQMFHKFQKLAKGGQDGEILDFGPQEVESDEQNYKNSVPQKSIGQVRRRLHELIDKDLTQLKDTIQQKNQQFNQFQQNAGNSANIDNELNRLGDQIEELQRNLQNFQNSKTEIQKTLQGLTNKKDLNQKKKEEVQRMCLKKMIIAAKQLQTRLPILARKREIFEMLEKKNLIILEGETGSGKSTQLPQILCEFYKLFDNPNSKPVLVTQPRRLATRSLAERVADQMQEARGHFVDYVASAFRHANQKAKIIFKLDRLVLDQMIQDPLLQSYSCLVIDQAHQRTISIDVILGLVKKLLQKRKDFKVIVTSASMDIKLFQKYFEVKTLKVSGRLFPVNIRYKPSQQDDIVKKIQDCIQNELLKNQYTLKQQYRGHILVFCSGVDQITRLVQIFQKKLDRHSFKVLPLHGRVNPQDQKKVFQSTKQFKIIFASRIAQTAITIDGVKVVIDPGFDRQLIYDQKNKFSSMKLLEISQSSAKQRAGRAGRTQQGYCFRLYSQHQLNQRRFNKLPQIKNIALDSLVLRLKSLKIEDVFKFSYIQRPFDQGMKTSIQTLKLIGCLDLHQRITTIGQFLVKLPVQPFLARAIVESKIMEQTLSLDPVLKNRNHKIVSTVVDILAMIINASNVFRVPQSQREYADHIKYKNFSHQKGDFFFLQTIYSKFKQNLISHPHQFKTWIRENYLNIKTLFQAKELQKQINTIVKNFTINKEELRQEILKCKVKLRKKQNLQDRILACLSTSFCANICLYSGNPYIGYTYIAKQRPVMLYGTSSLSLQGICPKWIVCYDLYQNQQGKLFCKVANEITFDFLQDTVDDYVFKAFKIAEAEKNNPFYRQLKYDMPTLLWKQIKQKHRLRQYNNDYNFMNKLNLNFQEDANRVMAYILCEKDKGNQKSQQQKAFQTYIQKLHHNAKKEFEHNYIGSIYVTLKDGFQIKKIEFKSVETVFQILDLSNQVYEDLMQNCKDVTNIQSFDKKKLKIFVQDEEVILQLDKYLQFLKSKFGNQKIIIKKQLCDKRRKIPQTKIVLSFFAGICDRDNIFLGYKTIVTQRNHKKQQYNPAAKMAQYLNEAMEKKNPQQLNDMIGLRRRRPARNKINFQVSKKGNGINCYNSDMDEVEVNRLILDLIKKGYMDPLFQMPLFIRKFREPQISEALKTNETWIQQIHYLIDPISKKRQNCINVWGYYKPDNNGKSSALQKKMRVQMKAEIKTFDANLFYQLKKKYDGEKGKLGCQKLHVHSMYDQVIARISQKVYKNLKDQLNYHIDNFKLQYPTIIFDIIERKVRRVGQQSKIMIICRSQNRQELIKPFRIIGNLFTPHMIPLQDSEFSFLNGEFGNSILENIEDEYDLKIYFGFDRVNKNLKLYSQESIVKQIQEKLKLRLKSYKFFTERISYRGKNLKKVEQILNRYRDDIKQKKNKNQHIEFFLIFGKRQISLTADSQTFNAVKNQIQKLIKIQKTQCDICSSLMNSPYKLYNCGDIFCWFCLASYIRQFKSSNSQNCLNCPMPSCGKLININDIKTILSEEELQKICDIKISKYVQKSKDYISCPGTGCEQIFQRKVVQLDGTIDCQLCGKNFCLKCNASHKNYTCEQWKTQKQFSDKDMQKLGIKKCGNCKNGIQKNGGCNHISCKCGAHVCWKCLKVFDDQNKCYDHLAKQCGGIFDRGAQ